MNPDSRRRWITWLAISALIGFPLRGSTHEGLDHDIERMTKALAKSPHSAEVLTRRARYYRLDGQLALSLEDLDRAREIEPSSTAVTLQRGLTLSALSRDADAEAELDRVLREAPDTTAALTERAKVRSRRGRPKLAIADLTAAIALEPALDLYLQRGRLQESVGLKGVAADGYRDGLARLGPSLLLSRALIRVEIEQQNYGAALGLIDAQIERGRLPIEWRLKRAVVLDALERPAEAALARGDALAAADALIRKRPTSSNLVARAEVHVARGDALAARRDLERALQNSPGMQSASALLAEISD